MDFSALGLIRYLVAGLAKTRSGAMSAPVEVGKVQNPVRNVRGFPTTGIYCGTPRDSWGL